MNAAHNSMRLAKSAIELSNWREIYTDYCILRAITQSRSSYSVDAISTLDHAIIIAGAPGCLDLVLDIIRKIQSTLSSEPTFNETTSIQSLTTAPKNIGSTIRCVSPPSFFAFQTTFSRAPFILRNFARDWPAMNHHPWRQAAYLRFIAGPGRVVPVEVGGDYRENTWNQIIMSWDNFLSTLDFEDQVASTFNDEVLYLAQHDLTLQFPALRDDVVVPDYIYAALTCPDYPEYQPPSNGVLFNTWLGPKDAMSPAHIDPYYNCYVQVVGYKSVWLAPPFISSSMYPISSSGTSGNSLNTGEGIVMNNTSQIDVFCEEVDPKKFPKFVNNVVPVAMTATLGPGDMLFFPPGWWHAMKTETTSLSLSLWF